MMARSGGWSPLSYGQEALWFLWKLVPETWSYNIVLPVGVRGALDAAAFNDALQALSQRHPSLRTEFREEGGKPYQRPIDGLPLEVEPVDATGWSDDRIAEALRERARRCFDLDQSAIPRVTLFRRAADHHVLLLVVHHIVSDLWSLIVVMDELRELYSAAKERRPSRLPELPLTFTEYVAQQRSNPEADAQWPHWEAELAGEIPLLDLPADHPRPAIQSFRGGTVMRRMEAQLTRDLKQLAGKERSTLFMILVAAYQVLLSRYTGQLDFVIGSPTSGRERSELQGLVGDFVNMVPLRADLSGGPTFRQLLARVRAKVVSTIKHQDYPFSLLVDRLHTVRDLSRSPIFQTTFVLQKFHRYQELSRVMLPGDDEPAIPFADLTLEPIALAQQDGQFDINVEMKEDDHGRLAGAWKYAADLFDAATIERMAAHFETLLREIVANPDRPIHELPLLTEEESREAIRRGRGPMVELPPVAAVHELFDAQAAHRPESIAVQCGTESLTYAELQARATRLARVLVSHGVRRDALVAVMLPRGLDFITALLAISKAGGAFLPLDPRHAATRTKQIVENSGAVLMITNGCQVVSCQSSTTDNRQPTTPLQPTALAYAMYTSGSTGRPKGVMVEHRGMVNHVLGKLSDLEMGSDSVLAQNGPPTFDIIVWQCLAPLAVGGRVVVFPDDIAEDPARLLAEVERNGVTVLQLVPSMLRAVIEEASSGNRPALSTLSWIVPTGEALPTDLCRRWLELYPNIPLLNTYGSTECSDDQCHYPIRRLNAADDAAAIASIGTPIHNMTAYVLDSNLAPVPDGVVGELYIGGIGVGRGYIGDPERTAAAFVPDPFSETPGARLYRTRDLARRRADGNLDFLGRVDNMIKLRGFRIEPAEIEAVLAQHPAVSAAAVVAQQHPSRERVLVAYVVATPGVAVDELRRFAAERLPQYMVPTAITFLESLPLNANGKLDPRRLPAPEWETAPAEELVPPRTAREEWLAGVWADVLGLERVGVTQDFFAIGGDSIKSIQIVARCKRAGIDLRPSDLFQHPTIAALAAVADRKFDIPPADDAPAFALSQEHLDLALAQVEFDDGQ